MNDKLRALFAAVLCAACSACFAQADPPRFAVLSLIGESMTVVTYQPAVGSNLDKNLHETVTMPDAIFDKTALLAANDAVTTGEPGASVVLLSADSIGADLAGAKLLDDQRFMPTEALKDALIKTGATRLLLITRYKAPARLQAAHDSIGSGSLEGLGFYIDRVYRTRRGDTGETGTGFLAPYAYFKVSLIDLATDSVLQDRAVTVSRVRSAARNEKGVDPWDALTPTQKVATLRAFVRQETGKAVASLLHRE